ncbi:Serine/threonine-protein phosphatase 7 long form homolog [Linum perenne]
MVPLLGDFSYAGSLSWGSACLAWLYREMCRASHVLAEQISGPLFILQIWAWEHFPFIARTPSDTIPWDVDECAVTTPMGVPIPKCRSEPHIHPPTMKQCWPYVLRFGHHAWFPRRPSNASGVRRIKFGIWISNSSLWWS